jgi:hypothetical protein
MFRGQRMWIDRLFKVPNSHSLLPVGNIILNKERFSKVKNVKPISSKKHQVCLVTVETKRTSFTTDTCHTTVLNSVWTLEQAFVWSGHSSSLTSVKLRGPFLTVHLHSLPSVVIWECDRASPSAPCGSLSACTHTFISGFRAFERTNSHVTLCVLTVRNK